MQFPSPGDRELAAKISAYKEAVDYLRLQAGTKYQVVDRPVRWFSWTHFRKNGALAPEQGWKIHVSCASDEAHEMLRLVVGKMLEIEVTAFKVPTDLQGVLVINSEMAGLTQAGKILTVYPASDEELSWLVFNLKAVWQSGRGPQILSDLPVDRKSSIYIRYGSFFSTADHLDALGRPLSNLKGPSGSYPDIRSFSGQQPDWVPKPPIEVLPVEFRHPITEPDFTFHQEPYLSLRLLNTGVRVNVSLALRKRDLNLIVAKRARHGVMSDIFGGDAVTRLRNEYSVLMKLAGTDVRCPMALVFGEDENGAIQIQSFIEGIPLVDLSRFDSLRYLEGLCSNLRRLHSLGIIHRDIKLSNVIAQQASVYLIDFEMAGSIGEPLPIPGGTPGYIAPEGVYAPISVAADIYSFGATIFEAAIGISPAILPLPNNRGRLIGLLNLSGQRNVGRLVQRLTEIDPLERMPLEAAEKSLKELQHQEEITSKRLHHTSKPSKRLRRFCFTGAVAAGLATRMYVQDNAKGRNWRNAHVHAGYTCQGLNIGSAGIILGLASLDTAFGTRSFSNDINQAARWLTSAPPFMDAHGLFTGNAGVALALGVIAERLGDVSFNRAASNRLAAAAAQDGDYDLFSGAAGILWAGCLLSELLLSDWPLEFVANQADKLISNTMVVEQITCWPSSPSFNSSREAYFGAAHGAAGISMALAAWSKCTGCRKSSQIAESTFEALLLNVSKRPDRTLPEGPGRSPRPAGHWCHGTAGLLWCVMQSDEHLLLFGDLVSDCAVELINHPPLLNNPTYCHGLAGILELLRIMEHRGIFPLEAFQIRQQYVRALRLLYQRREVVGVWSSEHPRDITPDLWIGFLGPAVALALEAMNERESMLSQDWLKKCARRSPALVQ